LNNNKLHSICFTGQLIHSECLRVLSERTHIQSIIISGPTLTPLPFLNNCVDYASRHNIPVYQSKDLHDSDLTRLANAADIGVSIGFGNFIKKTQFSGPTLGTFNLHPSSLPAYRGMHPMIYAMMNGDTSLGITLHKMDAGIDTGPIVLQSTESITPNDNIESLTDRIYTRGAKLLDQMFENFETEASISEFRQPTYSALLDNYRMINWNDSAWRINNLIRSLVYPWPMAMTSYNSQVVLVNSSEIVKDNQINPGLILEISDNHIKIGTGGHSIKIAEIRGESNEIMPISKFQKHFRLIPLESRLGQI
jgi:methionyl-tRNA formyltransferase